MSALDTLVSALQSNGKGASGPTTWQISDGSFSGFTFHVAVPAAGTVSGIMSHELQSERRLQVSEKPGLDGAEVEDYGRKPYIINAEVIFYTAAYQDQLTAFEALLNQGTTGILILPDLPQAIYAKFSKETRRTSTETCTILSLTFIEDNLSSPSATEASAAQSAISALSSNNPLAAVATIQDKGLSIIALAKQAQSLLSNNPVISAIQAANSAIVSTTSTINSVLNIPRTLQQTIVSLTQQTLNNLNNLNSAINSLQNFASLFNPAAIPGKQAVFNSTAGSVAGATLTAVDYQTLVTPTTTTVNGESQVVTAASPQTQVSSFSDAKTQLQSLLTTLQGNRQSLETDTSGNTSDYTATSIELENELIDLIAILSAPPSIQVFSSIVQSLNEICFENGLTVEDIDSVYQANTQLVDILAIPAYTFITIPGTAVA